MPRARYKPLNVFLNSRLVGRLLRERSGAVSFQYDLSWLAWEHVLPISLSLPLRDQAYSGAPVIAVFDNLLPDNNDPGVRSLPGHARQERTLTVCSAQLVTTALEHFSSCRTDAIPALPVALKASLSTRPKSQR
jgi:HipA-like protein